MAVDIINDARKAAYLVSRYPKKSLMQVLDLFNTWPAMCKDVAMWEAERQGWIEISKKKGKANFIFAEEVVPNADEMISTIQSTVLYAIQHQNNLEQDIDDFILLNGVSGFPAHDLAIALNLMLDEGTISNYTVTEGKKGENEYTFWTLGGNREKEWGLKRFKDNATNLVVSDLNELDLPDDEPMPVETPAA